MLNGEAGTPYPGLLLSRVTLRVVATKSSDLNLKSIIVPVLRTKTRIANETGPALRAY